MSKRSLTAKEILEIASHDYADVEDIKRLGCCGVNKAYQYMAEIRAMIKESGKRIVSPRGKVKMDYVLEYFEINEQRLQRKLFLRGESNEQWKRRNH